MVTRKGIVYAAFLYLMNAAMPNTAYSEVNYSFEGEGRDIRCYEIRNGKRSLVYGTKEKISVCNNTKIIKERIQKKSGYLTALPAKFDYYTALYNWKYFDWRNAEKEADKLILDKKLKKTHKYLYMRTCKKWPFIKFYSENCSKNTYPIDSRLSYLVFITESGLKDLKSSESPCGEIGAAQILPKTGKKYQKKWSEDIYWIEGSDYAHPINNMIGGMKHLIACCEKAECKKNLEDIASSELLNVYGYYVSNNPWAGNDVYWARNIANNIHLLYILPLADKASANGALISEKGMKKLAEIKNAKKKKTKIFKYAGNLK